MRSSVAVLFAVVIGSVQADVTARVSQQPINRLRSSATVPSREFATIQSAIDAVGDGGSIFVKAGVYREQLTIGGKRIRLSGAGSHGANRTEIAGAMSTAVDDHTRAVGLVNYIGGGGGVIEGIALRGGMNGIVGQGPAPLRDLAAPALANALTLRDVAISNTGRGILWQAPANLTIHGLRARNLRHNGVVFSPASAEGRASAALSVLDAVISQVASYGVLIIDSPSIGCQNQLSNVQVALADKAGIGIVRSGVCISGGFLTLNHTSGIYAQQSIAVIDGTTVQSSLGDADGFWGDGIISIGSEVALTNALINLNHRAGLMNWGGLATLSWSTFNCNPIDLNGEDLPAGFFGPSQPPTDTTWQFQNPVPGSTTCGCGGTTYACVALSSQPQPPAPIVDP